VKVQH